MAENKKHQFIIIFIFLLALTLRLINLGSFEVSGDEGSYIVRAIGWNDFLVSTTLQTPWNWYLGQDLPFWTQLSFFDHPPLHFATIWLSTHLFGINLWAARLPAVIFGALSVLLIMLIFYRFSQTKAAFLSGLFLAILPWHIWISRQAQQESLLIFLILLTIYLLININDKKIYYWLITGLVIGAAILTKYSAIIIFPLVVWYFFKKKWHKNLNFWFLVLTTLIIIFPVIFYNLKMYQLRGHFDLQFARLLNQNMEKDWPVNVQMITQGGIKDIVSLPWLLIKWSGIGTILLIIIGLISGFLKKEKKSIEDLFLSYGMLIIGLIMAGLTLVDPIRAAIVIPFLILSFGRSLNSLPEKFKINLILPIIVILFLVPSLINIYGDYLNYPNYLAASFKPTQKGFMEWEKWLAENQPYQTKPIHYSSLNQWAQHLYELTLDTKKPIIIFDHRFDWFALNWHFLRHTFYTTNYPVLHPTLFINFLMTDQELSDKLINKEIIYVQSSTQELSGEKTWSDDQTKKFNEIFNNLIAKQNPKPEIIKDKNNQELAKIWLIKWEK